MLEIFGYSASVIVIVSIFMKDMIKFRFLNTIACVMFVIYGFLHEAIPIVIMNTAVIIINAYYLIQWYNSRNSQ